MTGQSGFSGDQMAATGGLLSGLTFFLVFIAHWVIAASSG